MKAQPHINEKMREVLIEWMVGVGETFSFSDDTMFSSTLILDRFLSRRIVNLKELQLIGTTALLVAAKFHETSKPSLTSLVEATDNLYTVNEIINMEQMIVNEINFSLNLRNPLVLMDCYLMKIKKCIESSKTEISFLDEMVDASDFVLNLVKYLLYLQLTKYEMLKYPVPVLLSAALLIAFKEVGVKWVLEDITGYKESDLNECSKLMREAMRNESLHSIHERFTSRKFMQVAKIRGCACIIKGKYY